MRLTVVGDPVVITPRVLPEHATVRLHLRNDGPDVVEAPGPEVVLLDEHGIDLHARMTPKWLAVAPGDTVHVDFVYRKAEHAGTPARLSVAGERVEWASPTSARHA